MKTNEKKEHRFKGLLIGIISSLIATAIWAIFVAAFEKVNFLEALQRIGLFLLDILKTVFNFILWLLNIGIPVWIILIASFLLIVGRLIITKLNNDNPEISVADIMKEVMNNYTSLYAEPDNPDYSTNWHLVWEWHFNSRSGNYELRNLHPICACGCELSNKFPTSFLYCPSCSKEYYQPTHQDLVDWEKRIIHNVTQKQREEVEKRMGVKIHT